MNRIIPVILLSVFLVSISPGQACAGSAKAEVQNADLETVGIVTLVQESDGVLVTMEASNLPPGFLGFHIHGVGECTPPFTSAEGHFNPQDKDHPHHAGDLPNLLVNKDGSAFMAVKSDRFKLSGVSSEDSAAIIIHPKPDNHGNIPERYTNEIDEATLSTGDAGSRIACGIIKRQQAKKPSNAQCSWKNHRIAFFR